MGAGAAGLLAARELARAGRRVTVLEARTRVGGRVHTCQPPGFTTPIETGAELLHGEVPLTKALLREAGLAWQATAGETYVLRDGEKQADEVFFELLAPVQEKLQTLAHDMPLADFLAAELPGPEYAAHRAAATQFAEGYDAADPARASAFALRDEWAEGGAEDSPRPVGGYGPLLAWLAAEAQAAGATLVLGAAVAQVRWQPGRVAAQTANGRSYAAQQLLCTVPLGVWQRPAGQPGHLAFAPELPTHRAAAAHLGNGPVIKFLFEFDQPVWQAQLPEMEFLLSDALVPTWWSQLPDPRPLLSGWLAGPAAERHQTTSDAELLALALESLAALFALPAATLRAHLRASHVSNWGAEPFSYGAYSYATVGAAASRAALAAPVANTLFFAGEALYDGPAGGTVEAALASGQQAVRQVLAESA